MECGFVLDLNTGYQSEYCHDLILKKLRMEFYLEPIYNRDENYYDHPELVLMKLHMMNFHPGSKSQSESRNGQYGQAIKNKIILDQFM